MIRRDYIMRMAQEMAQVLIRAVSLKHQREYDLALRELSLALKQVREGEPNGDAELTLDGWIQLCRKHEQAAPAVMLAIADLLAEQGDVFRLKGRLSDSQRPQSLALGLSLEALLSEGTFVSADLVSKIDELFEATRHGKQETGVLRRLLEYLSVRGRFSKAEDVLFNWLETGDAEAYAAGKRFYENLSGMSDTDLERGDLPRSELEQGRQEIERAARDS